MSNSVSHLVKTFLELASIYIFLAGCNRWRM